MFSRGYLERLSGVRYQFKERARYRVTGKGLIEMERYIKENAHKYLEVQNNRSTFADKKCMTKADFNTFLNERPGVTLHAIGKQVSPSFARYLNEYINKISDNEELRPNMVAKILPIMVKYGFIASK